MAAHFRDKYNNLIVVLDKIDYNVSGKINIGIMLFALMYV